ncbi:MFS transporter [Streptomyces sp. MNU89]|uniref:CynX/NimT family MFS transporter n=1 Tax=Streptomyces sp. MNU89 TaxID=2560025 RepID=UPI001E43D367|nr:MFS transporter [Streptomyces sp. MNU89]MCC9742286.1 MFS transporter [Streptomyces sp. MNU89]
MPEDVTRCRAAARPLTPQAGRDAGRPVPGPDAAAGPAVPSDPADPATRSGPAAAAPSGPPVPGAPASSGAPAPSAPPSVWRTRLLIAGIALAALNLRPAITSLGALLEEVRDGLGISGATAGLLTSLPSLCFAVFGVMAPRLAKRGGPAPVLLAGMAAIAAGVLLRPFAGGTAGFLAGSALALAGIALSNVLMPVAVKRWFPDRVGTMTGLYSMTLALGTALAAASAVPVAEAFGGSWRAGLAVWALPALAAVLLWLPLARVRTDRRRGRTDGPGAAADRKLPGQREHERTAAAPVPASAPEPAPGPARDPGPAPGPTDGTARAPRITRSPTAWALGCFFGFQSTAAYITMGWLPQIFRDAGLPASTAGALLAVTMGLGVPLSFLLPRIAAGMRHQSALAAALGLSGLLGYAGLYFAPAAGAWAWALFLGISNCAFPLVLTLIGMRSRTSAGVIRLSAFAQSTGYLISVPGPLLIGVLYQHSGGWGLPLALMSGLMVVQLGLGVRAGRQRYIEDEGRRPLPAGPAARTPAG